MSFERTIRAVVLTAAVIAVALTACDEEEKPPSFEVTSPAFGDEETIPIRHTCDGEDISLPLQFDEVPDGAASFAVIVDEPEAPDGRFTHWLLWGLPSANWYLDEDVPKTESPGNGMSQGVNDAEVVGYSGPCPGEEDSDEHRYVIQVYALDAAPVVAPGAVREALEDAMDGHVVGKGRLVGYYERED
jgi:Raf kinase inhibitor-like YbhB/YbcL family protein